MNFNVLIIFVCVLSLANIRSVASNEITCKDKYVGCTSWKTYCTSTMWGTLMRRTCPITCNSCSGATTKGVCGIENWSKNRISGGSETAPNQYPWMVRLPMGCGGSFITNKHILTAKHCFFDKYGNDENWRGTKVKYSVHNQYDVTDYEEVVIKDYVMPTIAEKHDIAIIILEKAVDLSDKTIGTVCLPESTAKVYKGKKGLAMGWGWNPAVKGQSVKLFKVGLTVNKEQGVWLFTKTIKMNGKPVDVCRGDSGGPLVYKKGGRWTIIGTVQGGDYCDDPNHTGRSGRWNRVTAHLKWINSVIGV